MPPPTVGGRNTERVFVAVPLAPGVREALAARLPTPLPGRPVPPERWHLTLRFVGDVDPVRRAAIVHHLGRTDLGPPFRVRFGGLGAFPSPARARVLWLGADAAGEAALRALAARIEQAVRAAGVPAEPRPFAAHLTLARLAPPRSVAALVAGAGASFGDEVAAPVDEAVLFRSHLGQGPPRYEALARVPLGAGEGTR